MYNIPLFTQTNKCNKRNNKKEKRNKIDNVENKFKRMVSFRLL